MNPKPIFIVGVPKGTSPAVVAEMSMNLTKKMDDYHVVIYENSDNQTTFRVFYTDKFKEVEFENYVGLTDRLYKTSIADFIRKNHDKMSKRLLNTLYALSLDHDKMYIEDIKPKDVWRVKNAGLTTMKEFTKLRGY